MGKRLIFVLALVLALSFSVAAYAEVQNLKVSGDLLMRGVQRKNFTLNKGPDSAGDPLKYKVAGFTLSARLRVDADLTDDVSATVRLLNEREWGNEVSTFPYDTDIQVDLAYVMLKEFLYSPLTLTVGRQELRFGNALLIGFKDAYSSEYFGIAPDLTLRRAFDAIRATLNYDPLVVDIIYSKIDENDPGNGWYFSPLDGEIEGRDADLYGMNAKYDLSGLGITGTGEVYYFNRVNKSTIDLTGKRDTCQTVGALVGGQIRENLTGSLEFAYQFGDAAADLTGTNGGTNLKRRAWATQAGLNLALSKKWSPNLGLIFTYVSGDDHNNSRYSYWDPMYEDQSFNSVVNAILPMTNVIAINAKASLKPAEDVTITGVYGYYHLAKEMDGAIIPSIYGDQTLGGFPTTDKNVLGHAVDLLATYDYTEDVQLGLTLGYFDPGTAFNKDAGFDHTATQLIGSMKVTF